MLSQKSDDRPHTAVQTQCNNTPNSSPQHTQVPLQDRAVLIIPSSCNLRISPSSNTILKECDPEDSCNAPSYFHMALRGIYSCQQHCDGVWTETPDLLKCYVYLYYLIPSRNFSFIMIAVLPIHYAVRQPLQLSPCQKVHP